MLPAPARIAAVAAVLVLLGAGLWRMRRVAPVSALFLVIYFAIVLAWPFMPDRFVWGIWPFVFVVPLLGIVELRAWHPSSGPLRAARLVVFAGAAVAAFGFAGYNVRGYRGKWWSNIPRRQAEVAWPLVNWTVAHTAPRAVVASMLEPMVYLYTGRHTLPTISFTVDQFFREDPPEARAQALRSILGAYHVDALWVPSGNSLARAAEQMVTEPAPELVVLDTLARGVVLAPSRSLSTARSTR
jgi:hypothetical protein